MAHLSIFSYKTGTTLLHRLDPRFKLLFMIMLSLGSLNAGFWGLLIVSITVLPTLVAAEAPLASLARELKIFFFFLFFILIARSLSTPGDAVFSLYGVGPTWQGIVLGLRVCWRLTLVVLVSLGLVISTKNSEMKAAIEYIFARVPMVPEKRVSTMLSLMVRFIPLILNQIHGTMEAQKSRCVDLRRNPVTRLLRLAVPAMRRVFQSGDRLAIAMASRCYTDERTTTALKASSLDWIIFCVVCFLVLIAQKF